MSVEIRVLVDNEPNEGLMHAWGWSAFIKVSNYAILFDAGPDPQVLLNNATILGIDLRQVDLAVLSHHHLDHAGGFEVLGRLRPGTKIYVPPGRIDYLRSWGLEPQVNRRGIELIKGLAWLTPVVSTGIWGIKEHALVVMSNEGPVLVTGCSHPGVDLLVIKALDITESKYLRLVIGGFHGPSQKELDKVASVSKAIAPTHCSGYEAKEYVRMKYPNKYLEVKTGTKIVIP